MIPYQQSTKDTHHASGVVMGGPWQLRHVPIDGLSPNHVSNAALAALRLVDMQMSPYKHNSDLMQLNRAPLEAWVEIPLPMASVMQTAQTMSAQTDGGLNITLGHTINAWGFGATPAPAEKPSPNHVTARRTESAFSLEIAQGRARVKKHDDIAFDLCALAKGFAVDQAAKTLCGLGVEHFVIEAAGEVYAQGCRPDSKPWQVGLELPIVGHTMVYQQINLDQQAVATSGSYRKQLRIAGETFHHTIDPATGAPLETDLLSVTVLDKQCMHADAMATALFIKGVADGSRYADQHNIPAVFLVGTETGMTEVRSIAWVNHTKP